MESQNKKSEGVDDLLPISQEEENHVRMYLLLFGVSERAVRAHFDKEFDPARLHATLKKEIYKLIDLKEKRIINQSQWSLLFPKTCESRSSKFDVTLMTTLLTNLSNLSPYDKLPLKTDTSISADLARIRYYRNYISHVSLKKDEPINFTKAWDDISGAVGRLGGQTMHDECTDLRTKGLDRSTVPWNIKIQINSILAEWKINDSNFVETRAAKHVLERLHERSCVTITAASGVGKTSTLRHVALEMEVKGYDIILVSSPHDIVKFHNPNKKTLFVIDDFCGTYTINLTSLDNWKTVLDRIKVLIQNKLTKVIVACRLQVYQDEKFSSLSIFQTCACNLQSDDLCLLQTEKQLIAELYLETKASTIIQYCNLFECFPLLCKLYSDNTGLNISDFFQKPFFVYKAEIDKLHKVDCWKYCVLALCVMFNNRLKEECFTGEMDKENRKRIKNICEQCKLQRGTSRLLLLDEMKTLEHSFLRKEEDVYKTIHDKIFDFLVYYFGQKMIICLIKNADSAVIMQRFLLDEKDGKNEFITVVPPAFHEMYIQRMIEDWSEGRVECVFRNINMNVPEFRQRFLCHIKTFEIAKQKQLALICGKDHEDTVLFHCCAYGTVSWIQWCIYHGVDVNQSYCNNGSPLLALREGHIEIVKNKADMNKCSDNRVSPLMVACLHNHIEIVKVLLKNNADTNMREANGASPLLFACQNNYFEIVKSLLDNKANINKCDLGGSSPLCVACQFNHIAIVNLLLQKRADINKFLDKAISPLMVACLQNHIEIVKILLKNNANINMREINGLSPLSMACQNNHIEIVKILLENEAVINNCNIKGTSPLFDACQRNHIELVILLLQNRADINKCQNNGTSPLMIACFHNHIEIVKILLKNNADINMCEEIGLSSLYFACQNNQIETVKILLDNKADTDNCSLKGMTPLSVACQFNHIEIVNLLLQSRADINKVLDKGPSPLMVACLKNHKEIVKLLLKNNADINMREGNGLSPLFIACQNNHIETVKILLDNKADINNCNRNGTSPLCVSSNCNHIAIVKLLLEYKADIDKCQHNGESPLFFACKKNHVETIKVLLHHKADINKCTGGGVSPLVIACHMKHLETVKLLLDDKADIREHAHGYYLSDKGTYHN